MYTEAGVATVVVLPEGQMDHQNYLKEKVTLHVPEK
jgi:hypothetical protein